MENKNENKTTKQATLYGGFVEETQDPLNFVKVHNEVVNEGDQFSLNMGVATLKVDDEGNDKCVTLIDGDKNQALTVYFNQHADAQFKSTPNGVRLGGAVARCMKADISSNEDLVSVINENDLTLHIVHNGKKGRLWTVALRN